MPSRTFQAESSWLETNSKLYHLVLTGIELPVKRITEIPEYYRNTGIPMKNIGIPVKDTY